MGKKSQKDLKAVYLDRADKASLKELRKIYSEVRSIVRKRIESAEKAGFGGIRQVGAGRALVIEMPTKAVEQQALEGRFAREHPERTEQILKQYFKSAIYQAVNVGEDRWMRGTESRRELYQEARQTLQRHYDMQLSDDEFKAFYRMMDDFRDKRMQLVFDSTSYVNMFKAIKKQAQNKDQFNVLLKQNWKKMYDIYKKESRKAKRRKTKKETPLIYMTEEDF